VIDRFAQNLVDLVLRPETFFARYSPVSMGRVTIGLALVCGLGAVIERFDLAVLRQAFHNPGFEGEARIQPLMESWSLYWGAASLGALVATPVLYYLGGLWIWLRAVFAGATRPDGKKARALFTYSTAIWAGPTIVAAGVDSLIHENFAASLRQPAGAASFLLALLPFWSILVAYRGALVMFPGRPGRMAFWFAAVPMVLAIGTTVLLFAGPFAQMVRALAASNH
jgi:hypothetical protein